jgi:DNA-binding XRE family transcriptional regulator
MDEFQKQMDRLRRNPVFAAAFAKRRTEAEVAFQIRRLREAKGWSQKDLAKKVGCSQQAVSAVEQDGYKRHLLPLLRRIAAVLDADVVVALVPKKNPPS